MIASSSSRSLLKRAFTELGHIPILPCTKRRRLSSVNTLREASSAFSPTFFSANARWQPLQSKVTARQHTSEQTKYRDLNATSPDAVTTHPENPYPPCNLALYKTNPPMSFSRLSRIYGQLSKSRLTFLVVLTAMSGVALSPSPTTVSVLLSTALGTALCSASANTFNQIAEVPFDAQMARTRLRPLVRGAISSTHATAFAITTGVIGPAILAVFANPVSALLGAANIGLYAGIYTTLKRTSVVNTWVGAIVGGVPPLIGWSACGGGLIPSPTCPLQFFPPAFLSDLTAAVPMEHVGNPLSALALFCLLFSWQFPHFNSLAHIVRDSYAQGGYKMLPVINPTLNTLLSLRHTAALVVICAVLTPLSGLTTWTFAITSLAPNAVILRAAWRFWRRGTEKEAKVLWNISLWYLPVVLGLMMFHKPGMEWSTYIGWGNALSEEAEQDSELESRE